MVHIAAAGDLNITSAVVQAGGDAHDYTKTFQDVACLLADADLAVLNFEGLLVGEPYGSTGSAPQALAEALHSAGVDLVQMANSYSISQGTLGLGTTLQNIRAAGMEPLGAYASNEEYQQAKGYTICEVEGVRIAFVAFTKGMNSMTLPAGSENCVNVLYEDYDSTYQDIDREKIAAVMTAVQQEEPDITIAGAASTTTPSASPRNPSKSCFSPTGWMPSSEPTPTMSRKSSMTRPPVPWLPTPWGISWEMRNAPAPNTPSSWI